MIEKVTLIGLGLIASSIAQALNKVKVGVKVSGYDNSPEVRRMAQKLKVIEVAESIESAVSGADLTILCVPVGSMGPVVSEILLNTIAL